MPLIIENPVSSPMVPPIADNMSLNFLFLECLKNNFYGKVDNLHSTDDGEASEKSHGATYCRQHVHKFSCPVLGDSVKCWGVKVDSH